MKLVEQEEQCGCVIACIAMVLGKTYQDIRRDWQNDFQKKAVTLQRMMDYLGDMGYAIVHKHLEAYNHKNDARAEMLRPFAPMHILHIKQRCDVKNSHVVVMDAKGKLFCPGGFSDTELRGAYQIIDSIGLYK